MRYERDMRTPNKEHRLTNEEVNKKVHAKDFRFEIIDIRFETKRERRILNRDTD